MIYKQSPSKRACQARSICTRIITLHYKWSILSLSTSVASIFEFFEELMENLDPDFQIKYSSTEKPVLFGLQTPPISNNSILFLHLEQS
jgi:hypothetical protein